MDAKINKIKALNLEGIEMPDYDMMNDLTNKLHNDMYNQLEDAIIEGLKRKGFEFEGRIELEQFVKDHCRCEDRVDLKEKVYYVKEIPFFLWKYTPEIDFNPIIEDRRITMSAVFGNFSYL